MIETYIVTGKYQPCVAPTLHKGNVLFVTPGNDLRLEKSQVKYDLRKFGFTNRVVNREHVEQFAKLGCVC